MENLPPPPQEKELPAPHEKLLRPPTFWEKQGKAAKWLAIGSIIFFVLILASTIIIRLLKPKTTQPTQPPVSTVPTTTPISPDPTANWQTYTNEKYGFEVKYPENFKEQKSKSSTILLEATKTEDGSSYYIRINVMPNYKIDQIISKRADTEKIIIGDHSGYKYFYTEGAGMSEVALVQAGQDTLSITFDSIGNGHFATSNDRKIYVKNFIDQILSTFKFIDQTPN